MLVSDKVSDISGTFFYDLQLYLIGLTTGCHDTFLHNMSIFG